VQIQEGLSKMRATGAGVSRPACLGYLAGAYTGTRRFDEASSTLAEAMTWANENEDRHQESELYLLKGELLLAQSDSNTAEALVYFQRAIAIAQSQSAKSLGLRATTSLARLLASQGRRDEARTILAEIYGWFTEGFDTLDLKDAKALLDRLDQES